MENLRDYLTLSFISKKKAPVLFEKLCPHFFKEWRSQMIMEMFLLPLIFPFL